MFMNDLHNLSDFEVIRLCIEQDRDAFSEIVARYKNLVYSIVLRMVDNTDDANDMAQEVFIKAYKNLARYHPEFKFSTWIMRIATNHVIDFRRKRRLETVSMDENPNETLTLPSQSNSPEGDLIQKEDSQQIKTLLNELPDIYKVPIVLFHQQGMSYQEISEVIQEPLSKVKNRIFRGRRLLKEGLSKQGGGDYAFS